MFSFEKQPETDTDSPSSPLLFRLCIRPFQLRMTEILVSQKELSNTPVTGRSGPKGSKAIRAWCVSSLLPSVLTSLSGGPPLRAPGRPPQPQAIQGLSKAPNPRESVSFPLAIPGKSLQPIADSDWLAFPSLNQPWDSGECPVLRPHLMTVTKSPRGVTLQTRDAGKKGKRMLGGREPQISSPRFEKHLTCSVSNIPLYVL